MKTTIRRGVECLLFVVVVAYAALVMRDFSRYVLRYPYLAVDDGVANVSYSLATQGRYGFLASPIQGFTDVLRDRGFFNYGPWYFYLGAGLIWLFGYSLTTLRAIHPAAILAIAATACWWFGRRGQIAAGALVALGLLHSFTLGQWPMIRPDVMVSVFAVLLIVSAGRAMEDGRAGYWFLAGLGAGCGALTHLIAWSLLPCCVLIVAIALFNERPSPRRIAIVLSAVALGMIAAATMFYASFGFRVRDHLDMLTGYRTYLGGTTTSSSGYRAVLAEHLRMAFWYLSPAARVALAVPVVVSLALLAAAPRFPLEMRRRILAVTLPPVAVLLCYLLSLSFYPSYHTGYAILLQVAGWWCAGAVMSTTIGLLESRLRSAWRIVGTAAALVVAVASVSMLWLWQRPNPRLELVQRWVNIEEYLDKIDEFVPQGATAWGTAIHGIESPGRLELVEFTAAWSLIERSRQAHAVDSLSVAPAYVLWDYPLNRDNILLVLRGGSTRAGQPKDVFGAGLDQLPSVRYRVVAVINAPPYGVTRVYERIANADVVPSRLPAVSAYDVATRSWQERLEGPLAVSFLKTAPVRFSVDYTPTQPVPSDRSVVADLPAGRYLLRVSLAPSQGSSARGALVCVTSAATVTETIGELGPGFDVSPYAEHDDEAYLVHEHAGGPVYVSQFDRGAGAAIEGIDVYRIRPRLQDDQRAERPVFRPMPPLSAWVPLASPGIHATMSASGALVVDGDASRMGYQVTSPRVPSRAFIRITVRAAVTSVEGAVCLGALDGTGTKWLASGGQSSRDFTFTVDESASFRTVFYNCNTRDGGNARSRFTISKVRYAIEVPGLYVDRLVSVRDPANAPVNVAYDPRVRSFPADLVVTEEQLTRTPPPLGDADMQFHASLALVSGDGWMAKGKAETRFGYLLRTKPQTVDGTRRLVARVRVRSGGVTIGLLKNDDWAGQVNLTSAGEFIVVLEPPGRGTYDVVVANFLPERVLTTDVVVSSLGWIPR